jgi:hypothetical protein
VTDDDRISHLTAARELMALRDGVRGDIRGWVAYSSDRRAAGTVDRLLVEIYTGRIRYASILIAPNVLDDDVPHARGSVLVPIGFVRPDDDGRTVRIDRLTAAELLAAPRLPSRPVNRGDENAALAAYGLRTSRDLPNGRFYDRPEFQNERLALATSPPR